MKYQINLLPPKEQNIADKVIYFSFNYLRYILVITQFVVICVFFYRFKVDQDIIDLKETIDQKEQIIKTVSPLLKDVSAVNTKLNNARGVINKQEDFMEIYNYFYAKVPPALTIISIKFDSSSIESEGVTQEVTSVKMFYEELLKDNRFAKVELANINKAKLGYEFSLKLQGFKHKDGL